MPVVRRIGKRRRKGWNHCHRFALSTGIRMLGAFNGHREPWPMDEARLAWSDLGDGIMAEWAQQRPTLRPWGWWVIDQGIERPRTEEEQRQYLRDHGHLNPDELEMIAADTTLLVAQPRGGVWRG